MVPGPAKPRVAGLSWVGLGWAGLGEKRIFCLQAHKCLYWARPLVSLFPVSPNLPGWHEFSPSAQKGAAAFWRSPLSPQGDGCGRRCLQPHLLEWMARWTQTPGKRAGSSLPLLDKDSTPRAEDDRFWETRLPGGADPRSHCVPRVVQTSS